mmetsp:Transcript_27557/g.35458  ORF Transcript_27557/g.35458 Transcript_27557/m.35458 type:complete len:89 (-) Transcript_27557:901-1167(-)
MDVIGLDANDDRGGDDFIGEDLPPPPPFADAREGGGGGFGGDVPLIVLRINTFRRWGVFVIGSSVDPLVANESSPVSNRFRTLCVGVI